MYGGNTICMGVTACQPCNCLSVRSVVCLIYNHICIQAHTHIRVGSLLSVRSCVCRICNRVYAHTYTGMRMGWVWVCLGYTCMQLVLASEWCAHVSVVHLIIHATNGTHTYTGMTMECGWICVRDT